VIVSLEGTTREPTFPRLGLTLAPAHATMATRRAAGLRETIGLLVRDVQAASRAEQAGAKIGDGLPAPATSNCAPSPACTPQSTGPCPTAL
jgi:S1-C subfamily serine protease